MLASWSFMSGLVLLNSFSFVFATWSDNFAGFFPEYNHGFQQLLNNECADKYTEYLEDSDNSTRIDSILEIFGLDSETFNVVQCLLHAAPELVKAKMAAAQVAILQFYFGKTGR